MRQKNARVGLWLFTVYLCGYSSFVLLAALRPDTMEATPLWGVNLAIWSGLALIVAAVVMAVIYGWACGSTSDDNGEAGR